MRYKNFFLCLMFLSSVLFSILLPQPPKVVEPLVTIDPLELNFDKWVDFVEGDWSDKEDMSGEHIYAVKNKCENIQKIVDKFISKNLKLLNIKPLWFNNAEPTESLKDLDITKKMIKRKDLYKFFDLNDNDDEDDEDDEGMFKKPILPLAEKLIIPRDSKTFVFGDFHGNFDALKKLIKNFIDRDVLNEKLELKGNNYFIFLGDYVDRGQQGIEILLTLFRLKIQNPKKVILIRGNHESFQQNLLDGFLKIQQKEKGELLNKLLHFDMNEYEQCLTLISSILFSYELMPFTVFLGYENEKAVTEFIELTHGAIDHRYKPTEFLDSKLPKDKSIQFNEIKLKDFMDLKLILKNHELIERQPKEVSFSFNWSDIYQDPSKEVSVDLSGRGIGFLYSAKFIDKYFNEVNSDKSKIELLIRGHMHTMPFDMRNGRIGASSIGNTAITLMSGIYNPPKLAFDWIPEVFDWEPLNYYPTFLELTPPQEGQSKWSVKSKYLKDSKEENDDKFEIITEEELLKKEKEINQNREEIDKQIKHLKISDELNAPALERIILFLNAYSNNSDKEAARKNSVKLIKIKSLLEHPIEKFIADISTNDVDYFNQKLNELIKARIENLSRSI